MDKLTMTTMQLAAALRVSRITVWRWRDSGELPTASASEDPGRVQFYVDGAAEFVARRVLSGRWKRRGQGAATPAVPMGKGKVFRDATHAAQVCYNALRREVAQARQEDRKPRLLQVKDAPEGCVWLEYEGIAAEVRRAFGTEVANKFVSLTIPF